MSIKKAIYEHLITKPKYNRKCLELEIAKEDKEKMREQRDTAKRVHQIQKQEWEKALIEQEQEIIKLKKRKTKNVANNKK